MASDFPQIRQLIDPVRAGERAACGELVTSILPLLRETASSGLRHHHRRLVGWVEADDVTQCAAVRLWRSLERLAPEVDAISLLRLMHLSVRRELLDMNRKCFGPHGRGTHESTLAECGCEGSQEPEDYGSREKLEESTEFHEVLATLPKRERAVTRLLWYDGLKARAAAKILGISLDTFRRRRNSAFTLISRRFGPHPPAP